MQRDVKHIRGLLAHLRRRPSSAGVKATAEGSSGPWGEQSNGRWLRFDDAAKAYFKSKDLYAKDPRRRDFWVDWHAVS
jgi:hypothetical protein